MNDIVKAVHKSFPLATWRVLITDCDNCALRKTN